MTNEMKEMNYNINNKHIDYIDHVKNVLDNTKDSLSFLCGKDLNNLTIGLELGKMYETFEREKTGLLDIITEIKGQDFESENNSEENQYIGFLEENQYFIKPDQVEGLEKVRNLIIHFQQELFNICGDDLYDLGIGFKLGNVNKLLMNEIDRITNISVEIRSQYE